MTDSTILIKQASWIGGDPLTALDLDVELTKMAPGGWYWSFAHVGDWIYHAIRSPKANGQRIGNHTPPSPTPSVTWSTTFPWTCSEHYTDRLHNTAFVAHSAAGVQRFRDMLTNSSLDLASCPEYLLPAEIIDPVRAADLGRTAAARAHGLRRRSPIHAAERVAASEPGRMMLLLMREGPAGRGGERGGRG